MTYISEEVLPLAVEANVTAKEKAEDLPSMSLLHFSYQESCIIGLPFLPFFCHISSVSPVASTGQHHIFCFLYLPISLESHYKGKLDEYTLAKQMNGPC